MSTKGKTWKLKKVRISKYHGLSITEIIQQFVIANEVTGCWEWQGYRNPEGYGRVPFKGKYRPTHRLFYEFLRGEVKKELVMDHLCRNRGCCNPDHLEPVTHKENIMRGAAPNVTRALNNKCQKGHELVGRNAIIRTNGTRMCRACHLVKQNAYGKRKRKLAKETAKSNEVPEHLEAIKETNS